MLWALLLHALKAGACLTAFYLFFKLLLGRETFHRLNRILILGAVVASFVLPLCVITVYREVPAHEIVVAEAVAEAEEGLPAAGATAPDWRLLAGALFLAGAVATLALTLRSIGAVRRIIRRGERREWTDGTPLVVVGEEIAPFSWGGHIVVGARDLAENGAAILAHERAHVRFGHTWDLMLTDLAGCLQWFNPAMWLLRRELRAIHEYEADEAVLDSGVDARQYQLLLIKKAAGGRWYSVANSFNHSKLKNRITMMLQKRSSRWAAAKALLTLPLAAVALGAFAQTSYVVSDDKDRENHAQNQIQDRISPSGNFDRIEAEEAVPAVAADSSKKLVVVRSADSADPKGGTPLYIVDGKERSDLEGIDKERIASITILKDATATERYGERAKSGVIVVTTRGAGSEAVAEAVAEAVTEALADGTSVSTSISVSRSGSSEVVVIDKKGAEASVVASTTTSMTAVCDAEPADRRKSNTVVRVEGNITKIPVEEWKSGNVAVYIDGKKASAKKIDKLDPSKIRTIVVRKDKAAAEEYGEEAADGVILIETK